MVCKKIMLKNFLLDELSDKIKGNRHQSIVQANVNFVTLLWDVGKAISNEKVSINNSGSYEKMIVDLSKKLKKEYGEIFTKQNLYRMIEFAEQFPETRAKSAAMLSCVLSWSHILLLLPLNNKEAQIFYARLVAKYALTVQELKERIYGKEFESIPIAKNKNLKTTKMYVQNNKNISSIILENPSNSDRLISNLADAYFINFYKL